MEKDVVSDIWLKRQVLITQQSTCTHFPRHNHPYSLHSNEIWNYLSYSLQWTFLALLPVEVILESCFCT